MSKPLRILLIIILFLGFFEIGLFSSYTIVTSEAPNVKGLIDLQVNTITGFINPHSITNIVIKDPSSVNITNKVDTAMVIANLANVDGASVPNMTATTQQSTDDTGLINITITTVGYAASNSTNQTVISTAPTYKLIATAQANATSKGVVVDTNSIKVTSILKLYENETNTTS